VLEYLEHRHVSSLERELTPAARYAPLCRDVTIPEIIEKLALIDVMEYGENTPDILHEISFRFTYAMMLSFASDVAWDTKTITKLRLLHVDMLKKYANFGKKFREEGEQQKSRHFISKALFK
jgi:hypothetical protein